MPLRHGVRRLATDRRGLSTLEYAVLFLLVLVALLMVWQKLGKSLVTEVEQGRGTFSDTLQQAIATGSTTPGSVTLAQHPAVPAPAGTQVGPSHSNALASPGHGANASSPPSAAAPPPSAAALMPPSAAATPPSAASAPPPNAGGGQPPPATPGFLDAIGSSIQNSSVAQAAIGLGYGLHQAFTPGGFLVPISPSNQPAFQVGHSVGQLAGGVLQMLGGNAMTGTGLGVGGAGLAAEGPSLGSSTVVVLGGAALATAGVAVSTHGAANVAVATGQLLHMAGSATGKPSSGNTEAAKTGKEVHAKRAAERRASGEWDEVNSQMKDADGNVIEVPKRVDLKTGRPAVEDTQKVQPDAVSYKRGEILDDKPLGRDMSKDRQEVIRFIKAYQEKTGKLPDRIVIERYNPADGSPAGREVYSPKDFLP